MASQPCDGHGSIVRGKLCSAYPALIRDGVRTTNKRRYCVDCMKQLLMLHKGDWTEQWAKDSMDGEQTCSNCSTEANGNGGLSRFFCTAYLTGSDRRDYAALYCSSCSQAIAEEFELRA